MKKLIAIYFLGVISNLLIAQKQIIPDHWETAIYSDDIWNYFIGNQQPPVNWNQPGFNDTGWLSGKGGIGYGDGDDSTIVAPCNSIYMRTKFNVTDKSKLISGLLHADYDDGIIVYLNGKEIVRHNLSAKNPTFDTFANDHLEATMFKGKSPRLFNIEMKLLEDFLIQGENVLSAQVHNAIAESSDLSSNIFLSFGIADDTILYRNTPTWFNVPLDIFTSDLPLVMIRTGGVLIPHSNKVTVTMKFIDNGLGNRNHLGQVGNVYDGYAGIKIRGHASSSFNQLPYNFETRDSLGENNNVVLFGMSKENDWALIGNWRDKSMVRHALPYELSNEMGFYACKSKHCEVYIDDVYQGVYILSEKIKRDKNRVDIARLDRDENKGDDMSGGYIFRLDHYRTDGSDNWVSTFKSLNDGLDVHFLYHYPEVEDISIYQDSYLQKFVNDFEIALFGPDFKDPVKGYRAYINVPSFINFLIINEVAKNVDKKSNYFHKDKDRKGIRALLNAGPVWDFDWAWSAAFRDPYNWQYTHTFAPGPGNPPFPAWFPRLMEDPQFVNEFHTTYFNYRETILSKAYINNYIDSIALAVNEAQVRHFDLYRILGKPFADTYQGEIVRLKQWISERLDWIDVNMPGQKIDTSEFVASPITYVKDYGYYYGAKPIPNDVDTSDNNNGASFITYADTKSLQLYPNPVIDYLYINTPQTIDNISVYSVSGSLLKSIVPGSQKQIEIDLQELISGFYLVYITFNDGKSHTTKIIK